MFFLKTSLLWQVHCCSPEAKGVEQVGLSLTAVLLMISFFLFFFFTVGDGSMGRPIQLLLSGHTQCRRIGHEGTGSLLGENVCYDGCGL